MTNYTVNSNPNELTSFDRGASPDSSGTFLKYFLDFVRPSSNSSSNNGSGSSGATGDPVAVATRAPLRESASDTPSQVRKVCCAIVQGFYSFSETETIVEFVGVVSILQ